LPESQSQEFRSYRLTLGAIVFGLTGLAVLWLASSVAVSLWAHPRAGGTGPEPPAGRFSGRADDIDGLVRCQHHLEALFDDLNGTFARLTAPPNSATQIRQDFAENWPVRWRAAGEDCRFAELRDRGLGAPYDRLAWIHQTLQEVHRDYAALLERYIAHHEPRVNDVRRALETSRKLLDQRRAPHDARPG